MHDQDPHPSGGGGGTVQSNILKETKSDAGYGKAHPVRLTVECVMVFIEPIGHQEFPMKDMSGKYQKDSNWITCAEIRYA
jgi:hypothetical protein